MLHIQQQGLWYKYCSKAR